jgi:hypothetical protein
MLKKIILFGLIIFLGSSLSACCHIHLPKRNCCLSKCERLKCRWYKIVTNRHNEASCVDQQQLSALRAQIICNHCMFEEDYQCKNVYPKITNPPRFLRECL